jgi:protein-disulfide isomerase
MLKKPMGLVVALAWLAGCGGGSDLEEVKKGQADILAKLDSLEKTVQQMRTAPGVGARPAAPALDLSKVHNIPVGSSPVKGPQDAKVTIAEFSDFQCPFCAQSASLVDQVLQQYPREVKFVYKHYPLPPAMHPQAMPAAKAAVAAQKQGKFWEMHDKMFQNFRQLTNDKYKEFAQELGLDVAKFEKDFDSPEVQKQIDDEMAVARAADVTGTPTFFVNGKRVGTRSVEGFKEMIDAALKGGAS